MGRFRHEAAPDIHRRITDLVLTLEFTHVDPERVHCRRSQGSTADAYARIWEFPSVWQAALGLAPQYLIEVLSEHFDKLDPAEQTKILIHELLHVPKTFSGAVRNHHGQGESINGHTVNRYYRRYQAALLERERAEDESQLTLPW